MEPMQDGHTISVLPVSGGWCINCSAIANVLMFTSGARAEQAARALGVCLAGLGHDARVTVHDRHSALIGAADYFAAATRPSRRMVLSPVLAQRELENHSDLIEERVGCLGGTAYDTIQVAAERTSRVPYPLGIAGE